MRVLKVLKPASWAERSISAPTTLECGYQLPYSLLLNRKALVSREQAHPRHRHAEQIALLMAEVFQVSTITPNLQVRKVRHNVVKRFAFTQQSGSGPARMLVNVPARMWLGSLADSKAQVLDYDMEIALSAVSPPPPQLICVFIFYPQFLKSSACCFHSLTFHSLHNLLRSGTGPLYCINDPNWQAQEWCLKFSSPLALLESHSWHLLILKTPWILWHHFVLTHIPF